MKRTLLNLVLLCSLLVPLGSIGANVVVDGKAWRQVTETRGLSWNDLAAQCNISTGACTGGALDGWTWASVYEVGDLFSALTPFGEAIGLYAELNSTWAGDFLDLFTPTYVETSAEYVYAFTRTESNSYEAVTAAVFDAATGEYDIVANNLSMNKGVGIDRYGAWLYQPVAVVPEPEIYAMLGVGLGLIGWAARRRKAVPTI